MVGSVWPASALRKVDFPAPLTPTTAILFWRRTMPEDFNEARKLMEARLLELDALAAAEYERSKQPIDKEVVERDAVPGKPPKDWPVTKVKTVRTGRTGDPSILGTRLGILRDLRKMLGLDVK